VSGSPIYFESLTIKNKPIDFLKKLLFIYSHVHTLFGSFLPPAPGPHSLFFFWAVVGFELKASCLLCRYSPTLVTLPAPNKHFIDRRKRSFVFLIF
jgi:hypothetical protein